MSDKMLEKFTALQAQGMQLHGDLNKMAQQRQQLDQQLAAGQAELMKIEGGLNALAEVDPDVFSRWKATQGDAPAEAPASEPTPVLAELVS